MTDDWTKDNLREMQRDITEIRRDMHGREGHGGIVGRVERIEAKVVRLETLLIVSIVSNVFWIVLTGILAYLVLRAL